MRAINKASIGLRIAAIVASEGSSLDYIILTPREVKEVFDYEVKENGYPQPLSNLIGKMDSGLYELAGAILRTKEVR